MEHQSQLTSHNDDSLQWLNILRELEAGSLTLRNEEVYTLLTQAAWQVGPLSEDGTSREWHEEIEDNDYRIRLIEVCSDVLRHVQANWREAVTVRVLGEC
jgi:hypothetical protein